MNIIPADQYNRAHFIGGSAIPVIMGISPWKTPVQLYFDMIGWPEGKRPPVKPEVEKRYRRGKRLEPIVLDMIGDEQPSIEITARSTDLEPNRYQDPRVPYFAAEIDFEWRGEFQIENSAGDVESWLATDSQNGEIKTVHPFASAKWGAIGSDDIPVVYAAQALWGLGVTDRERTIVAALFGADNLQLYRVERDDGVIQLMRDKAQEFMENHVLPRNPPAPITVEDVTRLWPKSADDQSFVASEDVLANIVSLRQIQKELKLLEGAAEGLEFLIKRAMRSCSRCIDEQGAELATWKGGSQSRLDTELLKAKHPDIYKACSKKIEFRRFMLKGKE